VANPTLELNNRAFTEISVPKNAGIDSHKVYAAAGPFEPYVLRRTFANSAAPVAVKDAAKVFQHWNHREFGFGDFGAQYFIKVTDVVAGVESALVSAPVLKIPRSSMNVAIPFVQHRGGVADLLPTTIDAAAAIDDRHFEISVEIFETFRLVVEAAVVAGFLEFLIETAKDRAGPWRAHQVTTASGGGIVSLDRGLFRLTLSGSASLDIDVRELRFIRARVRDSAVNNNEITIDLERVGRVAVPVG
jgi:hypothetical protein